MLLNGTTWDFEDHLGTIRGEVRDDVQATIENRSRSFLSS